MTMNFDCLKGFVSDGTLSRPNIFFPVHEIHVQWLESKLGKQLPRDLKDFYREIGYGFLRQNSRGEPQDSSDIQNLILSPKQISEALDTDSPHCPLEGFGIGEVPILDLGEQLYLVIKYSRKGSCEGIYWPSAEKVTGTFEQLIEKMFYDDPCFYDRD